MIVRYFLLLFLLLASFCQVLSQPVTNYSGLKSLDLEKCLGTSGEVQQQIKSELPGQGLPKWPGEKMPGRSETVDATIERVSISEDRANELRCEVYFSGMEKGKIKLLALSSSGKEQMEISSPINSIDNSSGMLNFSLKMSGAENTYLKSGFLRVVYSSDIHQKTQEYCFKLPKRWRILPDNEKIVTILRPEPFKTAALIAKYSESLPAPGNKTATPVLKTPDKIIPDEKSAVANSAALGPAAAPISFYEEILADFKFNNPGEISNIALDQLYPDKNDSSGVYYYLPKSYSLLWEPDVGYRMSMLYGADQSGSGQVNMSAALSSNITPHEYQFVKKMLEKKVKNKTNSSSEIELNALLPNDPKISIKDNLASFNIPPDKVSSSVSSSIYDPIDVTWVATKDAADFIITALANNKEMGGYLSYNTGTDSRNYSIPLHIKLADKSTFGRLEFLPETWRNSSWRNQTPFSIKLNNLHIVVMNNVNGIVTPCIYTWTLGEKVIVAGSQVRFDGLKVPQWIDDPEKTLRMWIDYEVVPCHECVQEIVDVISSGVSSGRQMSVKFRSLKLLDSYGVNYLKVRIRSKFLDPRGKATKEKSITIERDGQDYEAGPFYAWEQKDLSFEYLLVFITEEKNYEGLNWISSKDTEIYMNKAIAEKSMGKNLPKPK